MPYQRLAYDDHDSAPQMHADCTACSGQIVMPRRVDDVAVTMPAPSLAYDDFPREVSKPRIDVSEAAAHLAGRLHLHLD